MAASTLDSHKEFAKISSRRAIVMRTAKPEANLVSVARGVLTRRALLRLSRLSDRMLADLGVEREAIVLLGRQIERVKGEAASSR